MINCDSIKKDIKRIKYITFPRRIFIIYIILFNLIEQILLKNHFFERYQSEKNEITLKFNSIGKQRILYSSHTQQYKNEKYYFFYNCPSKIYINNEEIKNLTNCTIINIQAYDSIIKLVWDKPLISTRYLFGNCVNIIEVNLTNFNTSLITDLAGMFQNCYSLKSVDLSNLVTNNNEYLNGMFYNCYSLKSINLSSFDTSKVISLWSMFYNCQSLISIDLSNFDTSLVFRMEYLFYNCKNLEYINIKNFSENKKLITKDMFYGIPKPVVICLDPYKSPKIYNITRNMSCITISCDKNWKSNKKK